MTSVEEIFEISDFTCVTDWERFIAELESIIHEWHLTDDRVYQPLNKGALSSAQWDVREVSLKYGSISFNMTHYCAKISENCLKNKTPSSNSETNVDYFPHSWHDLLDSSQEFSTFNEEVHSLVRFYDCREFVVLWPSSRNRELLDENIQNMVFSSLLIATSNTQCEIPVFVQLGERWRQIFSGVCQNSDVRTYFEMVHLKTTPQKCGHLSGLLDLFKEKVAIPVVPSPAVKVSVRIAYKLHESFDKHFTQDSIDFRSENVDDLRNLLTRHNFSHIPFGSVQDPLQDLILAVSWNSLNEDMLLENDIHSDLDPLSAPHWAVSVGFTSTFQCLMSEYLKEYMKLTGCHKTIEKVLGSSIGSVSDMTIPLERLAKHSAPNLSSLGSAIRKTASASGLSSADKEKLPLKEDVLNDLLTYLFPDAADQSQSVPDSTRKFSTDSANSTADLNMPTTAKPIAGVAVKVQRNRSSSVDHKHVAHNAKDPLDLAVEFALSQSKIASRNSLAARLSILLCHLTNSMQSEVAVCQIWREFLLELRYRLENGIRLSGLENVTPNLSSCFLNQKLQMLNCCIERKLVREQKLAGTGDSTTESEEFFDCVDDASQIQLPVLEIKPEGRAKSFDNKSALINYPQNLLYIPVTQDPAPLTEDMLDERTHSLMQLGTSEEAAAYRAKIQCSSLVSDMEAFKAANPGCIFEDFLKWYSPKDLQETVSEDGTVSWTLSVRMSSSDNLWVEAWANAKPIPVNRQKRLFDDTKEAEKILHWFESLKVSEIVRLTLPLTFANALLQLLEEARPVKKLIGEKFIEITQQFPAVVRTTQFIEYDDLRKSFEWIEATVSEYRSLRSRFISASSDLSSMKTNELDSFVINLMQSSEVKLLGGSRDFLGQILVKLFRSDSRVALDETIDNVRFPPWLSKEYIFRLLVPRPLASSRECVQRLYVLLKDKEFRSAGAFSEDIVFFTP